MYPENIDIPVNLFLPLFPMKKVQNAHPAR